MTQELKLWGGPMHGRTVGLQDGLDTFIIQGTEKPVPLVLSGPLPEEVKYREGTYSRVGKTQDFEWDGWNRK